MKLKNSEVGCIAWRARATSATQERAGTPSENGCRLLRNQDCGYMLTRFVGRMIAERIRRRHRKPATSWKRPANASMPVSTAIIDLNQAPTH